MHHDLSSLKDKFSSLLKVSAFEATLADFDNITYIQTRWPGAVPQSNKLHKIRLNYIKLHTLYYTRITMNYQTKIFQYKLVSAL